MKARVIIFSILIYAFAFANGSGKISVFSKPDGVNIRLDSVWIGKTPIKNFTVSPGRHHLEAINPQPGIWNIENISKEFFVNDRTDSTFHLKFDRFIKINSTPFHASLLFNDQLLGKTPLNISFEANRSKTLTLEKEGYETIQFVLHEAKSRTIKLKPLDISAADQDKSFGHNLFHRKIKSKVLLLSGSLITHWLSFYLKNIADDNAERFSRNNDPAKMDKYWNDTKRYDRYSEISLGISYAFLSGLIYTVIRQ